MIYEFGCKTEVGFIRNKFGSFPEVKKWAKDAGNTNVYSSVFGYMNQDIESSPVFSGLYFDLDNADLNLAYTDLEALLGLFEKQGISVEDINICFSGNKGFHVYINPISLGIKPETDLPHVFKKLAEELAGYLPNNSLDLKVYERRRLWRLINSRHGTSNLFKIQIPYPIPTMDEILQMAVQPQEVVTFKTQPNPVLEGWLRRARQEIYKPRPKASAPFLPDRNINTKIEELLSGGVGEGDRNQTCFYIACYLKSKNFSRTEIEQRLDTFASNCNPPLDKRSVEIILQSALKERPI